MGINRSEMAVACTSCGWFGKVKELHERLFDINGKNSFGYATVKTPCCPRCKSTDLIYKDGIFLK